MYTDSDWAGCQRTRRSTTGCAVMCGSCLVAYWSRTQVSVALSSAEAELNAAVKAACEWDEAVVWAFGHASHHKHVR